MESHHHAHGLRRSGSQSHDFRAKPDLWEIPGMGLSFSGTCSCVLSPGVTGSVISLADIGTWQAAISADGYSRSPSAPSAYPLLLKCISLEREVPTQGNSPAASHQSMRRRQDWGVLDVPMGDVTMEPDAEGRWKLSASSPTLLLVF